MGLFTPKWKNKNPEIRLKAVSKITKQSILAEIAENDIDSRIREAAFKELEESIKIWEDLSEGLSDWNILAKNMRKISNQKILLRIASKNNFSNSSREAAISLLNKDSLAKLESKNLKKAIKKADLSKKTKLSSADKKPKVEEKTLSRNNQEVNEAEANKEARIQDKKQVNNQKDKSELINLIIENSTRTTRNNAFNELKKLIRTDFSRTHFNSKDDFPDLDTREMAEASLDQIEDNEELEELAILSPSILARELCTKKLKDSKILSVIALMDTNSDVRYKATDNDYLKDEKLLIEIAEKDNDDVVRRVATEKLSNQEVLKSIAQKDKSYMVRREAVAKLESDIVLTQIIENEEDYEVLEAIILNDNFTNQKVLEKIAKGKIEKYGVAGPELAISKISNQPEVENKESSKEETKSYALSINVANVMGHQVSAKFNGISDIDNEKKILRHLAFSDVLDEIPEDFKMCNIYFGKLVDIHEAAAIMFADMEGVPSANVRVDEEGLLSFQGKEGDVKSCQITGELSWAGGSCKLTRTLFPSSQKEKYYLVVVNS